MLPRFSLLPHPMPGCCGHACYDGRLHHLPSSSEDFLTALCARVWLFIQASTKNLSTTVDDNASATALLSGPLGRVRTITVLNGVLKRSGEVNQG